MRKLICAAVLAACSLFTQANAAAIKAIGINPSTGQQTQIGGTNTLQAPTPTTANASINLPHGTAPTSPTDGDCWTTTGGLFCRISGATVGPMGSGGGGGTTNYYAGALSLIDTQTLSVAASSVTFSSIPQGYTDLVLVANARSSASTTNDAIKMQFNGDTGANYYGARLQNNSTSSVITNYDVGTSNIYPGWMTGATSPANISATTEVSIPGYSGTTFAKTALGHTDLMQAASSSNMNVGLWGSWWNSTAAITSISLTPNTGANFVAGSTFSLYGRGGTVSTLTLPGTYTVSTLPTATAGLRAFVTDATACSFGTTPTGGGSTKCPVYADGSVWRGG